MTPIVGPLSVIALALSVGAFGLGVKRLLQTPQFDFQDTRSEAEHECKNFKLMGYSTPFLLMSAAACMLFH